MVTFILHLLWGIQINSHTFSHKELCTKCLLKIPLEVGEILRTDTFAFLSGWRVGPRGARDGSPDSAISFWDQLSEHCRLEIWSVLSPCSLGKLKGQVLHTGHSRKKTLWSKLSLAKPAALRLKCHLGHFYLLISGLGTVNISLWFASCS